MQYSTRPCWFPDSNPHLKWPQKYATNPLFIVATNRKNIIIFLYLIRKRVNHFHSRCQPMSLTYYQTGEHVLFKENLFCFILNIIMKVSIEKWMWRTLIIISTTILFLKNDRRRQMTTKRSKTILIFHYFWHCVI